MSFCMSWSCLLHVWLKCITTCTWGMSSQFNMRHYYVIITYMNIHDYYEIAHYNILSQILETFTQGQINRIDKKNLK